MRATFELHVADIILAHCVFVTETMSSSWTARRWQTQLWMLFAAGSTVTSPAEAELRRAFAEVLAEVASLRLRNNALLRTATRVAAQPTADGGASRINGQPPSTDWLKQLTTNGPVSAQLMQAKFQDFASRFGKQQQPSGNGSL